MGKNKEEVRNAGSDGGLAQPVDRVLSEKFQRKSPLVFDASMATMNIAKADPIPALLL
jgi:hypothetical protein